MKIISSPFNFKGIGYLGSIYRPYLQILITSEKIDEWIPAEAVIDTGADYCLLPQKFAGILDINVKKECYVEKTLGVGGKEAVYLYKKGILMKINKWEKTVPVGFLADDNIPILLGRLGCLELLTLIMKRHTTTLET